jgi:hypothetical protein
MAGINGEALEKADTGRHPGPLLSPDEVTGPDHRRAVEDLSRWYSADLAINGTSAQYALLLTTQLHLLGPHNLLTFVTRGDLACCRGRAGDPHGAAAGFRRLLDDLRPVLQPGHPIRDAVELALAYWQGLAEHDDREPGPS